MAVPLSVLAPLHQSSREARRRAQALDGVPTLVIQGTRDHVARSQYTRRLVHKWLPGARYVELDGDHWLNYRSRSIWPDVERAVLDFSGSLSPLERPDLPSPPDVQGGQQGRSVV